MFTRRTTEEAIVDCCPRSMVAQQVMTARNRRYPHSRVVLCFFGVVKWNDFETIERTMDTQTNAYWRSFHI